MFAAITLLLLGGGSLWFAIFMTGYTDSTWLLVLFYVAGGIMLLTGIWKFIDEMGWLYPAPKTLSDTPTKAVPNKPTPTTAQRKSLFHSFGKNCRLSILLVGILLVLIPIYNMLASWILSWFMEPKFAMDHVHWFPITATAILYFFAGAVAFNADYNSDVFDGFDPLHKTYSEVESFLKKRIAATRYTAQRRVLFLFALPLLVGVPALTCLFSDYCLNFLFASPSFLLSLLLIDDNGITKSYLNARIDEEWEKHVCPHCGAIHSKFQLPSRIYDRSERQSLGKTTTTVTDKYTNGVDTIYVEHDETSYFVDTDTYSTEEYRCERCRKPHTKRNHSSKREYL